LAARGHQEAASILQLLASEAVRSLPAALTAGVLGSVGRRRDAGLPAAGGVAMAADGGGGSNIAAHNPVPVAADGNAVTQPTSNEGRVFSFQAALQPHRLLTGCPIAPGDLADKVASSLGSFLEMASDGQQRAAQAIVWLCKVGQGEGAKPLLLHHRVVAVMNERELAALVPLVLRVMAACDAPITGQAATAGAHQLLTSASALLYAKYNNTSPWDDYAVDLSHSSGSVAAAAAAGPSSRVVTDPAAAVAGAGGNDSAGAQELNLGSGVTAAVAAISTAAAQEVGPGSGGTAAVAASSAAGVIAAEFGVPGGAAVDVGKVHAAMKRRHTATDMEVLHHKRSKIPLTIGSLKKLLPGQWLNDEIINFSFELMQAGVFVQLDNLRDSLVAEHDSMTSTCSTTTYIGEF
jgi:hypothetical protein